MRAGGFAFILGKVRRLFACSCAGLWAQGACVLVAASHTRRTVKGASFKTARAVKCGRIRYLFYRAGLYGRAGGRVSGGVLQGNKKRLAV